MKKIFLCFLLFLSINCYADQLAFLTKEQAEKTVAFLKENSINQAILWCACCNGDVMRKLTITNFYYRLANYENYYEVVFEGMIDNKRFSSSVDLAYVFLRSGSQAKCLGKLLNFQCDPCTLPFDWVFDNNSVLEIGQSLIATSDCSTCHKTNTKFIGPSYFEIAKKYNDNNIEILANKIINGGSGIWGPIPATPHPNLKVDEAKKMVKYILSLKN